MVVADIHKSSKLNFYSSSEGYSMLLFGHCSSIRSLLKPTLKDRIKPDHVFGRKKMA